MLKFFRKIKKFILDILFPIQCLGCGKEGKWICESCLENIKFAEELFCPICKRKSLFGKTCFDCQKKTALTGLLVACSYQDELLKKAIHIFKYKFVGDLSIPLSIFLIQRAEAVFDSEFFPGFWKENNSKDFFLIIPVPLHKKRFRWRGFNQSELLAKKVSDFFDLSFRNDILIRFRDTSPQTEIRNRESRMENIKGAFLCVNSNAAKDKKIILIDDVSTTSATLNECAKELSKAGAKEIWGLVLARG